MFNRKSNVNGSKNVKKISKVTAFIGLFILLTLVFTMSIFAFGSDNVAYADKLLVNGVNVNSNETQAGGWFVTSKDYDATATGSYTYTDKYVVRAIAGGVVCAQATANVWTTDSPKSSSSSLHINGGAAYAKITSATVNASCYIKVTSKGALQGAYIHCKDLTITLYTTDETGPQISAGGAKTTATKFTVSDSGAGIKSWSYKYTPIGGSSVTDTKSGNWDSDNTTRRTSSDINFQSGFGTYAITATDNVGNTTTTTIYRYQPEVSISASDSNGGSVWLGSSTSTTSARYSAGTSFIIKAKPNNGYYFVGFQGGPGTTKNNYAANSTGGSLSAGFTYTIKMGSHSGSSEVKYTYTAIFKEITAATGSSWTTAELKSGSSKTVTYDNTIYSLAVNAVSGSISGDGTYSSPITYGGSAAGGEGWNNTIQYAGTYTAQVTVKCGDTVVGQSAVQNITVKPRSVKYYPVFDSNGEKTYDGTSNASFSHWTTTDTVYDDLGVQSATGTTYSYISGTDPASDVGTYTVRAYGKPVATVAPNTVASYNITNGDYTDALNQGSITPRALTISGITVNADKDYDGTVNHTIASYGTVTGFVTGESGTLSGGTAVFGDKNVGTGKDVTVSGIKLTGNDGTKITNYKQGDVRFTADGIIATITLKAEIKKRSITVTAAANDKIYDGTDTATVSLGYASGLGLITGDEVTLSHGAAKFTNADVGSQKTVTVIEIAISGGKDGGNYTLTSTVATTIADITPFGVHVYATDASKTYGTSDPAFTYTYDNGSLPEVDRDKTAQALFNLSLAREAGEDATESGDYSKFIEYKIYFTAQENNGVITDGAITTYGNYSITMHTAKFTVNKLKVYVNAKANLSFQYGGLIDLGANSNLNLLFTVDESFTPRSGYQFTAPQQDYPTLTIGEEPCVGEHTPSIVTAHQSKLATMHRNFTYALAGTPNNITITPATITAKYVQEAPQYGEEPEFKIECTGYKYGDDATVFGTAPSINIARNANGYIDVGEYTLAPEGYVIAPNAQGNANYTVTTVSAKLTVTKRTLNVYFYGFGTEPGTVFSRPYDGTAPDLDVYYRGFAVGEDESVLTTPAKAELNANTTWPNQGTYGVRVVGGEADNYAFVAGSASSITITKVDLTVTYTGETITYGGDPRVLLAYSGFVAPYVKDGVTVTEDASTVFTGDVYGAPSITFLSQTNKAPSGKIKQGTYTFTPAGGYAQNYNLVYVSGTLVVNPKALTATYSGNEVVYGNTPDIKFGFEGFVDGDNQTNALNSVSMSGVPTDAGTYDIGGECFTFTAIDGNYTVTVVAGTLLIKKAELTVTAQTQSFVYGEVGQDFSASFVYTGFVNGEAEDVLQTKPQADIPSLNAHNYVDQGKYTLEPKGAVAKNYNFTYQNGTLTVTKRPLTITYLGETVTYNGTAIQPDISKLEYVGFAPGESLADLGATEFTSAKLQANTNANVAGYDVNGNLKGHWLVPYDATATNYEITNVGGYLYIAPVTITVTYAGESVVYGTSPALDITYTGWLESMPTETASTMVTTASALRYNGSATMPVNVGVYNLTLTEAVCKNSPMGVPNYVFTYVNGDLTVTQKTLTVAFEDETLGYGDVYQGTNGLVFPWTPVYSGFEYEDDENVLVNPPVVPAPSSFNKGTYSITPVCATGFTELTSEANYKYSFVSGTLTISGKLLTVKFTSDTASYGEVSTGYDFTSRIVYEGVAYGMGDTDATVLDKSGVTLGGTPTANTRGHFDAGVYTITPSGLVALTDNYIIDDTTYVSGTLTVNKIDLEVYVDDFDSYTDNLPTSATAFTLVYSGFITGEDQSVLAVLPTVDVAALPTTVGFHTVTPVMTGGANPLTADTNYNIVLVARTNNYNIYNATFDMSDIVFNGATFTYDGTAKSIFVLSGIPTVTAEGQSITAHYLNNAQRDVGTYTVTVYFTHNVVGYSRITNTYNAELKIEPRAIDYIVDTDLLTEVYGNADKTLTGTPSWIANDDDLGVTISLPGFEGQYRPVNEYTMTVDQANLNANYDITFKTSEGDLLEQVKYVVTKRDVEITLRDQQSVYNGDVAPVVDDDKYDVTSTLGIMDGDNVNVDVSIEAVAKYNVRAEGYALTATYNNANYNITFVDATYTIAPASLTVTLAPQTQVYDGTEAVLSQDAYAYGTDEVKSGDTLVPVIRYSATGEHIHVVYNAQGAVTGYAITADLVDGNYSITVVDSVMTITKRPATVTLRTQTVTYGDQYVLNQSAYDVVGAVEGDDLGIHMTRQGGGIVGKYDIYATASNTDYDVTVIKGVFEIQKRDATLDVSRMDGATFVYVKGGVLLRPDAIRYITHDNDDMSDYTIGVTYPDTHYNAGTHQVTVFLGETANYNAVSEIITITVLKADVTINNSIILATEYVYTGSEQVIDGATFNNSDADAELIYDGNVFTDVPESGYMHVSIVSPETANYNAASIAFDVPVKRAVMNFANYEFRTDTMTYDGLEHVVAAEGVPAGVTVVYSYDDQESETPFKFRNAGVYAVSLRFVYDSANYQAPAVGTSVTLSIFRASITVKANDLTGQYGDPVVFTDDDYSIIEGSVCEGDDLGVEISTERAIHDIGVYKLSATASNPNYNIKVSDGSYTIVRRQVTVRFDNLTSVYGDADLPITYSVTAGSVLEGDSLLVTAARASGKDVGEYLITGTVENSLYDITVEDGTYTIVKRPISIVVKEQSGTSATDVFDDMFTVEGGVVAGDSLDITVVGNIGSEPGEYALTAKYNTQNLNYDITVVDSVFTLMRLAKITVGSSVYRKIYDGSAIVADVTVNSGAPLKFTVRGNRVSNSFTDVGSYEVAVSADAYGEYSAAATVYFTVEICPVRLTAEVDGLIFAIDNVAGFEPNDKLIVERNEESTLPNSDFMQKLDGAYKFVIESDGINYTVGEYFGGSEVELKVKPTDELIGSKKFSSYVVGADGQKLGDGVAEVDEDGFISLRSAEGESVYFVSERENAVPTLIAVCGLAFGTALLVIILIFRRKA